MRIAIIVLSEAGLSLGWKIRGASIGEVHLFGPSCVVGPCGEKTEEPGVSSWTGPLRKFVPDLWDSHDAIIAIMAVGIVVRLIAPLIRDKRTDPAVVAIDEAGQFVVSVLGGHQPGANDLTRTIASTIAAIPVITTASDAWNLPAVDLVGRELGWTIERVENLTRVAAAVVRRERIGIYQDAGDRDWWSRFGPWPDHFEALESLESASRLDLGALLVISDRIGLGELPETRTLVYRPRTLVAGIGCKRGTSIEVIEDFLLRVFSDHGLSPACLASIVTVTLKADEPALIALAKARSVPLLAFTPGELANQAGIERPSERVLEKIGISSVAEASSLRASGSKTLLVPKQIGPGVTLAISRIDFRGIADA